jgi:hypothetical protein
MSKPTNFVFLAVSVTSDKVLFASVRSYEIPVVRKVIPKVRDLRKSDYGWIYNLKSAHFRSPEKFPTSLLSLSSIFDVTHNFC